MSLQSCPHVLNTLLSLSVMTSLHACQPGATGQPSCLPAPGAPEMLRNGRLLWSSKQNKFLVAVKPLIFLSLLSDADRLDQGSPGDSHT